MSNGVGKLVMFQQMAYNSGRTHLVGGVLRVIHKVSVEVLRAHDGPKHMHDISALQRVEVKGAAAVLRLPGITTFAHCMEVGSALGHPRAQVGVGMLLLYMGLLDLHSYQLHAYILLYQVKM